MFALVDGIKVSKGVAQLAVDGTKQPSISLSRLENSLITESTEACYLCIQTETGLWFLLSYELGSISEAQLYVKNIQNSVLWAQGTGINCRGAKVWDTLKGLYA